jgi:prophage antirepressor-like protein
MPDLIPFQFDAHPIRVHLDNHDQPWWVLNDCCAVLGLTDTHKAATRLDPDDRKKTPVIDPLGRPQDCWLINESGLYTLLLRSTKPEAKQFKRWVTSEVLPAIRKTGKYEVTPASERYPELRAIVELVEATAEARVMAEEAKATADRADANALRALETQLFFTIAEYVYVNRLHAQIPESAYKACSDHLRSYCLDQGIPFRKIPVGGKRWDDEYGFHISVYTEALPGWLKRRYAQAPLHLIQRQEPPHGA